MSTTILSYFPTPPSSGLTVKLPPIKSLLDLSYAPPPPLNSRKIDNSINELVHFVTCLVFYLCKSEEVVPAPDSPMAGPNSSRIITGNTIIRMVQSQAYKDFSRFVKHILTQVPVQFSTIALSLKYIHRLGLYLGSQQNSLSSKSGSEPRIWLTSLMLADAFLNDNAYTMASWASISNLTAIECSTMKREFLNMLRFDLAVDEKEYVLWLNGLELQYMDIAKGVLSDLQQQQQSTISAASVSHHKFPPILPHFVIKSNSPPSPPSPPPPTSLSTAIHLNPFSQEMAHHPALLVPSSTHFHPRRRSMNHVFALNNQQQRYSAFLKATNYQNDQVSNLYHLI